jgi:hypothetical protein
VFPPLRSPFRTWTTSAPLPRQAEPDRRFTLMQLAWSTFLLPGVPGINGLQDPGVHGDGLKIDQLDGPWVVCRSCRPSWLCLRPPTELLRTTLNTRSRYAHILMAKMIDDAVSISTSTRSASHSHFTPFISEDTAVSFEHRICRSGLCSDTENQKLSLRLDIGTHGLKSSDHFTKIASCSDHDSTRKLFIVPP